MSCYNDYRLKNGTKLVKYVGKQSKLPALFAFIYKANDENARKIK
jgi:hypothetical protein